MKITRNLIEDLIPLYLSGEASEDSQKIITEFIDKNPELKYLLDTQEVDLPQIGELKPEKQIKTLKKVKTLSLMKSLLIGIGLFFSLSIFVFTVTSEGEIQWLMLGNNEITMVYACIAILCWLIVYFISRLRSKLTS